MVLLPTFATLFFNICSAAVYFEQIRPPYRSNKATLTMIPVHLCAVEGHRLSL